MALVDDVYEYIEKSFKPNEPIFLSELKISDIKEVTVRQQIKKLIDAGLLKRFDSGIYYLPKKSIFKAGSTISIDDVVKKKYLLDGKSCCGYISGILFANQLGLTTQVPYVYEIYSNKATTDYRETELSNFRIILRNPYCKVSEQNVTILQFLDLLKDVVDISEVEGDELKKQLINYMKKSGIEFDNMKPYLQYYPERIYKNMYEVGLLNGISA